MKAPLIFIHYGPARYLRWTLLAARRTNPEKRIILLGDESNRRFACGVAEFFLFENYATGAALAEFERVFQVIQGERHRFHKAGGIEAWLKFVFRRWFLIYEFLKSEEINAFWTFDSDTLLLAPLVPREKFFSTFEATTQCRGMCLNGWIGSRHLVERYLTCINDLFNDDSYLQRQRDRLKKDVGLAFNEMDAFCEFCKRASVKTCRASQVIEGAVFDDALAFIEDYEPAPQKILGRTPIKRLWISSSGELYIRQASDQVFVRLLSCNMSWMPDFFWKRLFKATTPRKNLFAEDHSLVVEEKNLREISLDLPLGTKFKKFFHFS